MKHNRAILFLALLVIASLACSLFGSGSGSSEEFIPSGGDSAPGDAPPSNGSGGSSGEYDTEFPLPSNVENYMDLGDAAINYQTSMELNDVVDFYRSAFGNAGYDERDITTSITDTTFSIVWDGHPNGKAIVVQGVDLGNGTVNVNVRFEEV